MRRTPFAPVALVSFVCVVMAPATTHADSPGDAPSPVTASGSAGAFDRGLESYDAHDYPRAIAAWEDFLSQGKGGNWRILYNLGLAYESNRQPAIAVDRYDAFIKRVAEEPGTLPAELEDRRQDAVDRATRLRKELGHLVFVAPTGSVRVPFRLDGGEALVTPVDRYLAPGLHAVVVGEGARSKRAELEVVAGRADTFVVEPLPPAPATPKHTAPERRRLVRVEPFPTAIVIAGAGLTAASFGLPLGLGLRASSLRSDAVVLGRGHSRYASAKSKFESARTAYDVSYVLPAVLAAATVGVAIVGGVRAGKREVVVGIDASLSGPAISASGAF